MARRVRSPETFSLSFLDCICCGFGGMVLLLTMVKIYEPMQLERHGATVETAAEIRNHLEQLRTETRRAEVELEKAHAQLDNLVARNATLRRDLSELEGEFRAAENDAEIASALEGQLALALQTLSDEMKRLFGDGYRPRIAQTLVGGIPVDSEYIIFVVDTSGSMASAAWPLVLEKFTEVLDVYPKVKGLQIMNDMGSYMFSRYAGKWIPDTPKRRQVILDRMRLWQPFSNSSPVEGIRAAVETYYAEDRKISIYVFGDDFAGGSLESVVRSVDEVNARDKTGTRRVRVHAIGFPVQFSMGEATATGMRFAHLMRTLCERNGGTFVGLPRLR